MKHFQPNGLIRENILALQPYASARSETGPRSAVMLDANENPMGGSHSRYPDPLQHALKADIAASRGVQEENIFLGNGSDEVIDLLLRICCKPGSGEHIIVCPPTYGMYEVAARTNDVTVVDVPLDNDFQLAVPALLSTVNGKTKLVFICSPNNPTGNLMDPAGIEQILAAAPGLVVIDEAYIDFAGAPSMAARLQEFPNLVVLQTFSKAWGLAGLRIGIAFAHSGLVAILNKVKLPYNISGVAQDLCRQALAETRIFRETLRVVTEERGRLQATLAGFPFVVRLFPSDANFLLARVTDAPRLYQFLLRKGIVVRQRHTMRGCENCLRISVGSPGENERLITALKSYKG